MNELQTNVTASELIECAPAVCVVTGKTLADKRLSVIANSPDMGVMMVAVNMKGTVGKQAREMQANAAAHVLARSILSGNYAPIAAALSLELGESVSFGAPSEAPKGETVEQFKLRQREDWELWGKLTQRGMQNLPQLSKAGKVAPKRARCNSALSLYAEVKASIAATLAERAARRANEAATA